ncbi:MAG: thioredoxin domain-containing protein [Mycobacteriales bacterium]
MANRLERATSPYLLQHKDNPVDWWPWSAEAFAEARRRDVPVLLSVGYAACHWCHVMAHESFEDAGTAELMNAGFVCVKVDREERPDVDAVYMEATQGMTGSGGWPMTCFLTPDGEPFFCGTYFPRPQFRRLLAGVGEAWRDRRDEVTGAGQRIVAALARPRGVTPAPLDEAALDAAAAALRADYDTARGGFGGAPKFPPSMVLEFLLRRHARLGPAGAADGLDMVVGTAEAMARGGMYDQLAGGFARYSVDADWVVPHFEKMLYDNALLLRVYAHLWRETGSPLARRVAAETAGFLLRDLRTPEGGFASALDADAAGVEGLTYAWTPAQLRAVLGEPDAAWAGALLSVGEVGTFEHGASTLQLPSDPDDPQRWARIRDRLHAARSARPQPARDDKVVTGWTGLAIAGLADAGVLLGVPAWVGAAAAAADLLLRLHLVGGRLRRTSRNGVVGTPAGVLEDYADLAEGLLALHQATAGPRWLAAAGDLLDVVLARFGDGRGGFHDTADDAETLIRRPWDPTDGPVPAGPAAAAGALLGHAALSGRTDFRAAADSALATLAPVARAYPRAAGWACAVAEAALAGPLQVAVAIPASSGTGAGPGPAGTAGPGADPGPAVDRGVGLVRVARLGTSPGLLVVAGEPDAEGVPLLESRPLVGGRPAAYVCRGFVCDRPTTDPAALAKAVRAVQAP